MNGERGFRVDLTIGPSEVPAMNRSLALTLALTLASATTSVGAQDAAQLERVRSGTIEVSDVEQPGASVRWGRATGIVEASPDSVWSVVTDYARYAEFLPHFRASRVLSRRGNAALVYLEAAAIRGTVTIWSQMRIRELAPRGTTRIIEATMMQGNVERMAARWELTPVDGGASSMVTFQFLVDPDLPFPSSIVSDQNRSSARRTVEALRRRVTTLAGASSSTST